MANGDIYKKIAGVWTLQGNISNGVNGQYGGAITMDYLFNTSTANADPGTGQFALNQAVQNTATAIYIDVTSHDGLGLTTVLQNLCNSTNNNKALLRVINKTDPTKYLLFYVTGGTANTGYQKLNITIISPPSSASPFNSGDECLLCVSPIGDQGSGSSPWNSSPTVNENGTSLTNWTQVTPSSWSVVSSAFQATTGTTSGTNQIYGLRYTNAVPQSAIVFQADVAVISGGSYSGSRGVGLVIGYDGTTAIQGGASTHDFGVSVTLTTSGTPTSDGTISCNTPFTQLGGPSTAHTFSFGTFVTIRMVAIGNIVDIYINGSYLSSIVRQPNNQTSAPPASNPQFVMVFAQNCIGQIKNVLAYQMTLP